ncbi:MAG: response regulator transcription factor [Stellaceae bacterium]
MAAVRRILIVANDAALCRSLVEQLERNGEFACLACAAEPRALDLAASFRCDAVLLDNASGGRNVEGLAQRLRAAAGAAPIFLLTNPAMTAAHRAFAGAADEEITKPLRIGDLVARLHARLKPSADSAAMIGPYAFRPGVKLLIEAGTGREVRLTEKEAAILEYLYHAGNRVSAREALLGKVWGYRAAVATHTLETHIYRLRRKIERDPARAAILVSEPGGYRLVP